MKLFIIWRKTLCLRAVACWFAAAGIWGILYPDIYFNKDVCAAAKEEFPSGMEEGEGIDVVKREISPGEGILHADRDEIQIKFRLWEEIKKIKSLKMSDERNISRKEIEITRHGEGNTAADCGNAWTGGGKGKGGDPG